MRPLFLLAILCLALATIINAQDIESKLSGNAAAQGFTVKSNSGNPLFTVRGDGMAAFGTMTPEFKLTLTGDGGIIAKGTHGSGTTLTTSGSGARLIWYPKKAAFRAGWIEGTQWDDSNIGDYSTATGRNTIAGGDYSTAMGSFTNAESYCGTAIGTNNIGGGTPTSWDAADPIFEIGNGTSSSSRSNAMTVYKNASVAMGPSSTATGAPSWAIGSNVTSIGNYATALGRGTTASGAQSTAMGWNSTAGGSSATAMGSGTTANGDNSFAAGITATASGWASIAMGANIMASGDRSIAMGSYVSTNNHNGCFVLGDNSTTTTLNLTGDNIFATRYAGGYNLFSNSAMSLGVHLAPNGMSWSSISDSTKKCAYRSADGERLLAGFRILRLGSWNYKADPDPLNRHYGPMAQEWFAAFGHDGVGSIGCDTLLASADVDGVAYIAIQALERRTAELKNELDKKTYEVTALCSEVDKLRRLEDLVLVLQAEVKSLRGKQDPSTIDCSVHAALGK